MDKTDIGFIGLGHMGGGMVKSLLQATAFRWSSTTCAPRWCRRW